MRIFFILSCLLFSVLLWADPWGALTDYDLPSPSENGGSSLGDSSDNVGERYLLRPVLEGRTVKVRVILREEPEEAMAFWHEKVQDAYNEWFFNTAKHIRKARREREFADILPLLDRGIPIEFVEDGEDITIEFVDQKEIAALCAAQWAGACYVFDGPKIYVPGNLRKQKMMVLLLHEIGHSLGFSDQYMLARDGNTHPLYRGDNPDNTVMNSRQHSLTCDDADGIVNLIDITRNNHRGGNSGWRSLCKKSSVYYVGGIQLGIGPYAIRSKDDDVWNVKTYQNGALKEEQDFAPRKENSLSPFISLPEEVIHRDKLNRPLLAQGPNGEKIYYMHLYDSSFRLVTKDGKNLLAEERKKLVEQGKPLTRRSVWFYANKRESFLLAVKSGSKGVVYYTEGKNGEFVSLEMRFNKKNHVAVWGGSDVASAGVPKFTRPVAPASASASSGSGGLSGKLTEQVERKLNSAQQHQLMQEVERWYFNN